MDIVLKVRLSNFWHPPPNIWSQCLGAEWTRKANIAYIGKIDLGGQNDSI